MLDNDKNAGFIDLEYNRQKCLFKENEEEGEEWLLSAN